MTEKSFEAASEAEAQQLADEWIKAHPEITISKRSVAGMTGFSSGERFRKIPPPDTWLVIVEYDEPSN